LDSFLEVGGGQRQIRGSASRTVRAVERIGTWMWITPQAWNSTTLA
jgi:hypothetical protein